MDDDNDNWLDKTEVTCGSDPIDVDSFPRDNDNDGQADCIDTDDDNDGWSEEDEVECNTDTLKS